MPSEPPELDTIYIKDGWEACLIEYGTNVRLVKQLLHRGFQVSQVLPPDEVESIGYTLVWTKKLEKDTLDAPTIVL
jgi:hypothetical protein